MDEGGAIIATYCNTTSYAPGGAAFDPTSRTPLPCLPCPPGTETEQEGATSEAQCLAPPGWGWNATARAAAPCAVGSFKATAGRAACTVCGAGYLTDEEGAVDSSACFIPAGWGSGPDGRGGWKAWPCPAGALLSLLVVAPALALSWALPCVLDGLFVIRSSTSSQRSSDGRSTPLDLPSCPPR